MRIKTILKFCAASLAVMALSTPAKAEDDLLAQVQKKGELVIGTEMQFAPFDFLENGKQNGFNKDFFEEIGKELGVKVRFIDLPWPSVLPGLDAKKFDIVGGPILVTQARKDRYTFFHPVADGSVAFLKSAKNTEFTSPEQIVGKVMGGGKGSAQLALARDYLKTLPGETESREYIDNNQAYADLVTGRLTAVANSLPNISYVAKQRPNVFAVVQPAISKKVYFAHLTRKGPETEKFVNEVNRIIIGMHENGNLPALQKKWFGLEQEVPTTDFTPEV